jgi:hypothetical protein
MVGGSNAELDEVRPDNDLSQGGVDLEAPVVTEEARMLYNVGGHGKRSADLAVKLVDDGKYITKAPRGLSSVLFPITITAVVCRRCFRMIEREPRSTIFMRFVACTYACLALPDDTVGADRWLQRVLSSNHCGLTLQRSRAPHGTRHTVARDF